MLGMGPHSEAMAKLLKGGVSMYFPLKSRRPKRAGSPTHAAQINPIIFKAVKEHYHKPDPVAHLIGKANETKTLVNDVGCWAPVDSEAQLSTINIEFVMQLGQKYISWTEY